LPAVGRTIRPLQLIELTRPIITNFLEKIYPYLPYSTSQKSLGLGLYNPAGIGASQSLAASRIGRHLRGEMQARLAAGARRRRCWIYKPKPNTNPNLNFFLPSRLCSPPP